MNVCTESVYMHAAVPYNIKPIAQLLALTEVYFVIPSET